MGDRDHGRGGGPGKAVIFSVCGFAAWLAWVAVLRPHWFQRSWAEALLLLAAMVLVPWLLDLIPLSRESPGRSAAPGPPRGLLLASSLLLGGAIAGAARYPGSTLAGVASLPWLAATLTISWQGAGRLFRRGLAPLPETAIDAGRIFLAIGGVWTTLHCFGARPLGFDPVIVLLTGIHFHYAGFVFPILTGLAGRERPSRLSGLTAAAVVAGVPLVAVGITATQLGQGVFLEAFAAVVTATAGGLTSILHLQLVADRSHPAGARCAWLVAAVSLAFAMVLAAAYGVRGYFAVPGLDIPWMRALHGTANALGFASVGALGWSLAQRHHRNRFRSQEVTKEA